MRASLAISLSVLAAAAGGGCSTHTPRTDRAAGGATPPGLTLPAGKVFSLDTTTAEYVTPIAGTTASLVSVLASPGGQRRIELRDAGKVTVIEPAAWNLPPHGAADTGGAVLSCWNTLTGPAKGAAMPFPSQG